MLGAAYCAPPRTLQREQEKVGVKFSVLCWILLECCALLTFLLELCGRCCGGICRPE